MLFPIINRKNRLVQDYIPFSRNIKYVFIENFLPKNLKTAHRGRLFRRKEFGLFLREVCNDLSERFHKLAKMVGKVIFMFELIQLKSALFYGIITFIHQSNGALSLSFISRIFARNSLERQFTGQILWKWLILHFLQLFIEFLAQNSHCWTRIFF